MATGYTHYAGLKSADIITVGPTKAADVVNYTSISDAFDAMVPGGTMLIYPGTYSLSATETIDYPCSIIGIGDVTINGGTAGVEDRLIMVNKPAAGTVATQIYVENIKFVNAYSAADAVEIDNDGGATGSLTTIWNMCGFSTNAGLAFDIDQTTNTIDVFHYIYGARHLLLDDDCNFALSKAASEVHVSGYQLDGGETFVLGTANVASLYFWDNIIYSATAFTTGGAASIIENFTNCAKIASGAIAACEIGDMDATAASENIQAGTLAA